MGHYGCQTSIAATLTQVDAKGNHWPVVFESSCLTVVEQAYPAYNLELFAVVHALCVWCHYLLGSGEQWQPGNLTDFTISTDKQEVTWLRSKKDLSSLHVCWLDNLAKFSFNVVHVPGHSNPTEPLTSCGLPSPAQSTGETNQESQQEHFLGLGRDSIAVQELLLITRVQGAVRATAERDTGPTSSAAATMQPENVLPQTLAFIPLAGATLCTTTGVMTGPPTAAVLPFPDLHLSVVCSRGD